MGALQGKRCVHLQVRRLRFSRACRCSRWGILRRLAVLSISENLRAPLHAIRGCVFGASNVGSVCRVKIRASSQSGSSRIAQRGLGVERNVLPEQLARSRLQHFLTRLGAPALCSFLEAKVYRGCTVTSRLRIDRADFGLAGQRPIFGAIRACELPVEPATRFQLVINLKTTKALGLKVPQSLLQQADKVIR